MINEQKLREIIARTSEQWRSKNKELFSCFDQDKLWERIGAFTDLEPDADFGKVLKSLTYGESTRRNVMVAAISEMGPDQGELLANALELSLDRAFLTLYDRGALTSLLVLDEIPQRAQRDLDRIAARVEAAKPKPVVQVAAAPAPVDPVAQCVEDFHEMGMQKFKAKYMNDTRMRIHYETAIDRGLL
jgi:hypothetical protein